jgi:superfamily II DNA/RNA helicase
MSFKALGLSEPVLRGVDACGYTDPTPIQLRAVPAVLTRRDLIASAQTGTGKTAAFALPILTLLSQQPPPPHRPKASGQNHPVFGAPQSGHPAGADPRAHARTRRPGRDGLP